MLVKHEHRHHHDAAATPTPPAPQHAHRDASPSAEATGLHTPHANDAHVHLSGAHDKHAGHSPDMFRRKFWLSLLLTVPTVVWGHMLMRITQWHPPAFSGSQWISPL